MNLQSSMDQAVVNYLSLSNELRTDAEMLLEVNEPGLINESDISDLPPVTTPMFELELRFI